MTKELMNLVKESIDDYDFSLDDTDVPNLKDAMIIIQKY